MIYQQLATTCLTSDFSSLLSCGGNSSDSAAPSTSTSSPAPVAPVFKGELNLVAGNIGGPGNLDGEGDEARFNTPEGLTVDANGNMYIADAGNGAVRKITSSGVVTTLAQIALPYDVASDANGNVYVLNGPKDSRTSMSIVKIGPDSKPVEFAAFSLLIVDPYGGCKANSCGYHSPLKGIAVDTEGSVYTTDWSRKAIKLKPSGERSTIGTFSADVKDLSIDKSGNLITLVGDTNDLVRMDQSGTVTPIPVQIDAGETHTFSNLTVDAYDCLYIVDRLGSDSIRVLKVEPSGITKTLAIGAIKDVKGELTELGRFAGKALVVDSSDNLFSTSGDAVRRMDTSGIVKVFAGKDAIYGYTDGTGVRAAFSSVAAPLAVDIDGYAYVTDLEKYLVRKITPSGTVTTIAGTAGVRGTTNGTSTEAKFYFPKGITTDRFGNVYVSDLSHDYSSPSDPRTVIRKISPTAQVSTFAGPFGASYEWLGGPVDRKQVFNPYPLASDKKGNVYMAANSMPQTERTLIFPGVYKLPLDETTSIAPIAQEFYTIGLIVENSLSGVAIDANTQVFALYRGTNSFNPNPRIEKPKVEGRCCTPVGKGIGYVDGNGLDAKFDRPSSIALDDAGNRYVADTGNHAVRKIELDGTVTTLVGAKGKGNRLGQSPSLDSPTGIAFIAPNTLLITTPGSVLKYQ